MTAAQDLVFPPLLWGEPASGDALPHATRRAVLGCDAGLVTYLLGPLDVQAALVFAPELPLRTSMAMLPLCGVSFQKALGALAPPEVAVHLEWNGSIRVNGASCGTLCVTAPLTDPDAVPDWMVVGWTVPLLPAPDAPTTRRDQTVLYEEGCTDVSNAALVESWARHTQCLITRWEDAGAQAIHTEWRRLVYGIGEHTRQSGLSGTFLGVDEHFGMFLRDNDTTHHIPLTYVLNRHVS